jgi:HK97 family phage major capsid protein
MATIASSAFSLPKHLASGLWTKAQTGSTIAALSASEPMLFGETQLMTLNTLPKAQYVSEGAAKSGTDPGFSTKTVTPHKVQVTMRFNEEVQWADEDYQLGVLSTLSDATALALARALDLGAYHGMNPLTGAAVAQIVVGDRIATTTNNTEIVTATLTTPDTVLEAAAGLVIADGYTPNGIAIDPAYAWTIATARYTDGRKKYPELGLGVNVTSFEGIRASVSSTVSGTPEGADTNIKAIVGDFAQFRWGVQRRVGVEKILYGNPDGVGDLKANNQIALRAEVVYGWAVMDLNAFATVTDAVANV